MKTLAITTIAATMITATMASAAAPIDAAPAGNELINKPVEPIEMTGHFVYQPTCYWATVWNGFGYVTRWVCY